MQGRNPVLLLEQVDAWHTELNRMKKTQQFHWTPTFTDFIYEEGGVNKVTWEITELCSTKELHSEGKSLSHCVGSYSQSCANKRSAILSLRRQGERTATLEINLATKKLIQARGKANRYLQSKEERVVQEWVNKTNFFKA